MSIQGGINNALTTVGAITAVGGPTDYQKAVTLKKEYEAAKDNAFWELSKGGASVDAYENIRSKRIKYELFDSGKAQESLQTVQRNIFAKTELMTRIQSKLEELKTYNNKVNYYGDTGFIQKELAHLQDRMKPLQKEYDAAKAKKDEAKQNEAKKAADDKQAADKKAELDAIGKKIMEVK